MKQIVPSILIVFGVSACTAVLLPEAADDTSLNNAEGQIRPAARPENLNTEIAAVPAAARTVEEFDTTTAEQRNEAVTGAAADTNQEFLGSTIASLGSPTEPGFWLKTPLVDSPAKGNVLYPGSGKSVAVELIPIEGEKTAGSRMSLPAMRLIDAPLTGLPEVEVYKINN